MGAIDDLIAGQTSENTDNKLFGSNYNFIDADTLSDNKGNKYRIQGIDAPEIEKIINGKYKLGTAGGQAAFSTIKDLANKQGFTNVVETGEVDNYGRKVVDLRNSNGESFKSKILQSGILDPTAFTTNDDRIGSEITKARRNQAQLDGTYVPTEWDKARVSIDNAIASEGGKQLGFTETMLSEAELAAAKKQARDMGVSLEALGISGRTTQIRDYGRDLDNKSNNPTSDAFNTGINGAIEGMWGALELIGDTADIDWAKDMGEAGIERARTRISSSPQLALSLEDIDGFWGKDGFVQYAMNNAAVSLPYMAVTIGGALLAPATKGLSLAAPASLYSGTTWNDMEGDNKNAGIAIASGISQAALDRLGLGFLAKGSLLTKTGRNKAIVALARKDNITREAAKAKLLSMSRQQTAELMKDAGKFASQQIVARNILKTGFQRMGVGAGGEAITEALQEGIGYTAANWANNFQTWDANQFQNVITNAAVAGGVLGGGFSVPGSALDTAAWIDVAYRKLPAQERDKSWAGRHAEADIAENGRQYNIQEQNEIEKQDAERLKGAVPDINQWAKENQKYKDNRTTTQLGKDLWGAIPGLWRGLTRMAFDQELQDNSKTARIMGEGLGSNLQRSTSGATYENRKHHMLAQFKNTILPVKSLLAKFGLNDRTKSKLKLSDEYYTAYQRALAKAEREGRPIDWDRDLEGPMVEKKHEFILFHGELNKLGDKLYQEQVKHNPNLGYVKDYLSKYKSFNKEAIEANKEGFIKAVMDEYGMDYNKATDIANSILNTEGVSDIDDAFSVTGQTTEKFTPKSHKERTLGLSEKEAFKPFFDNNIFNNMSNAAKSAARYSALQEYAGDGNSKINSRLAKIKNELMENGWTEEEANKRVAKLAADLKDYFDAESGNYKRIKNDTIRKIQNNLLFFTTLSSLPLATLSNFVELMLVFKGMTKNQIFGTINKIAKSFTDETIKTMKPIRTYATGEIHEDNYKTGSGHEILQNLGFFEWEVGAAHTTGVTAVGKWHQRALDAFFKVILLQQWTNSTRAARAAIAGDFISDKIAILQNNRQADVKTKETVEAEEALRNLGMDPEFIMQYNTGEIVNPSTGEVTLPTEADHEKFADFMRDATYNFINEAVANPQSANRPKIFQDPRFALFTQFQGFISTFTANHIPKLWGEYVKRGTPAMKYNAFAVMSTMIMVGFVSQHLKDLLKNIGTDKAEFGNLGKHPHLTGAEIIRRGIGASGLLGTGERVIDFVFPIYAERYSNPITWTVGTIGSESAAISKVEAVFGGIGKAIEGDGDAALKRGGRLLPLAGPFSGRLPEIRDAIF